MKQWWYLDGLDHHGAMLTEKLRWLAVILAKLMISEFSISDIINDHQEPKTSEPDGRSRRMGDRDATITWVGVPGEGVL